MPPGPLRGRSEPMARAQSVLRAARRHGCGGVLLVSGPAGIGKTALLTEICRQAAAQQLRVAAGKCDPIEQVWPGAPILALLRDGRNPLAGAEDYAECTRAVGEPLLLADRVAAILEAAAPVLLAVDDVHWADRTSRFLVRTLMSRLIGLPVVWVLAARADFGAELARHDLVTVEHLRLGPLTGADLVQLATDRLGHAPDERTRRYLDAVGGNPFLATQFLAAPDSMPAGFTAAIAQQLAELPETARDLVALVAVAGRPLPMGDVVALAGDKLERAMADATESRLIVATGQTLACRHDLVREAVYAALGADVRALHRKFAAHYLTVAGDPLIAASHARLAARSGDLDSARILISAAERLTDVTAGELASLAFRTVRPAQPEWPALSRRCLAVLSRTQRSAEALSVADLLLAHADADLVDEIETEVARALWSAGRLRELITRTERALHHTSNPAVAARLRAARALAGARLEPSDVASTMAAAAVDEARATGDREALTLALHAAGWAAKNEARHETALRHFRELRSLTGASCLADEITELQFLDRYEHAHTLLEQARSQSSTLAPALHGAQLWQHLNLGRLDDADAGARAHDELARELGNSMDILAAAIMRVSVALIRGETETAAAFLCHVEDLPDADDEIRLPGLAVMRGWLAASRGDLPAAVETLAPILAGATRSCGYGPLWPCWMGLFFDVGSLAGDEDFVQQTVDVAELIADRNPGNTAFEGLALNLRGRSKNDFGLVERSAELLSLSPRPLLRGLGADTYGRSLLAAGRRAEGLAQLDRAWDEYHRADARPYRAAVQRLLREAGIRRACWSAATPKPATGPASLTQAEHRVATLIAAGHTNKSAATELDVSVNTVATHLRAAFTKLGVRSRVQLANALRPT
ncbi:AAA family ATPase [Kutzneria sp. NPDC052558]|uniref:AAA family ATPase n=1 Tax=Kutzneria sp. NPDC052558 TaxID=3364121 RepID=UPI0037C91E88